MIKKAQLIIAGTLVTATLAFAGQAILGGKRVKPVDTVTKKEISKEGDIVLIQECKPISKTKNWMLVDVVKKGESE